MSEISFLENMRYGFSMNVTETQKYSYIATLALTVLFSTVGHAIVTSSALAITSGVVIGVPATLIFITFHRIVIATQAIEKWKKIDNKDIHPTLDSVLDVIPALAEQGYAPAENWMGYYLLLKGEQSRINGFSDRFKEKSKEYFKSASNKGYTQLNSKIGIWAA